MLDHSHCFRVRRLPRSLQRWVDPSTNAVFAPNLILDLTVGPFAEDEWIGKRICIGESAIAQIIDRIPRCRVATHDPINPEFEEPLFGIMKTLDRFHQGRADVYAKIVQPGIVFVNDDLRIVK